MTTEPPADAEPADAEASLDPGPPAADGTTPVVGRNRKPVAAGGVTPAVQDRPLNWGERLLYQLARLLLNTIGRIWWHVRVEGRENVPTDTPFVLAPVHRSNIDTPLMGFVTRRQLRYMAKDTLWKHGWSGRLMAALGGFPVNRDTADRESLRTCEAALKRGEPVVIFPEGARKEGPIVTDLYQGAAFVALRGGVPIVPVGIGGSAGAMPKGSKFIHTAKVRIVIGAPIFPPPHVGAGARGSRRYVRELTAQLEVELQRLFDEAQRRSAA